LAKFSASRNSRRRATIVVDVSVIRTPDQRVRVFVSSTLGELAAERQAVRDAVERLRLVPVMFEAGARPHPPRELYRAYLAQSDVFVGVYWQRYGWVAPGEETSGLEDEFRLAGGHPMLLYLKEPSPEREERLTGLIRAFQATDTASYKRFHTPDELSRLVSDDLAVLLTERFVGAAAGAAFRPREMASPPVPLTPTLGREQSIREVATLLAGDERLVTITGPGGVGKTRVALEVARAVREEFPDGIHLVPLAAVSTPGLALRTIADQVGVRTEGARPVRDALVEHLRDRRCLLVLDNLEQVVPLGAELVELLGRTDRVRVLATSRQVLRVRGEREVVLPPLPLPSDLVGARAEPAVRLYADRAGAAALGFRLTDDNLAAVVELCRRLDGLPLAIELAAARSRLLPPARLLERLDRTGSVLAGAPADAPERHRTLRATLDWSYRLLTPGEQAMLARLSVFSDGFTLPAAEAVCADGSTGGDGRVVDVLEAVASLLDKSLLVVDDAGDEPRMRMLETVRAYAAERLDERGDSDRLRGAHLEYFRSWADRAQPHLCGPGQRQWALRVDPERANLRAAVATALERGDDPAVIALVWDVYVYYWIRDAVEEPESWMEEVAGAGRPLDEVHDAMLRCLQALTRISRGDYTDAPADLGRALTVFRAHGMDFESAVALKEVANVAYVVDRDQAAAAAALRESSALFEKVDHDWGVALVETMLGTVLAVGGDLVAAERHHRTSLERAALIDNEPIMVQALHQLALVRVLAGRTEEAAGFLADAVSRIRRGEFRNAATYCLDVIAAVALVRGDVDTAAHALTAAEQVRRVLRTPVWPTLEGFVADLSRRVLAARGAAGSAGAFGSGGATAGASAAEEDPFAAVDHAFAAVHPGG
jgi:predicted ATPase